MISRPSSRPNPRAHEERDRGASSIELVFYTPLLMLVILVTVQFALTWHGNQIVSAVARETARVVRTGGSIDDARDHAVDFGDAIGGQSLQIESVEITEPDPETVRVKVTGRAVEIVNGFAPSVSATVEGPIESFRARLMPGRRSSVRVQHVGDDRGSMAVEVIVLVPILLLMLMLIVAFGRYVSAQGDAQAIARDAVRAATLERTSADALDAARGVAEASAPSSMTCQPAELTGTFQAGQVIGVDLTCTVSFADLTVPGLPGSTTITATSSAPLDEYRRSG